MTYKEKLAEIKPDFVKEKYYGGAYLCPCKYFKKAKILCNFDSLGTRLFTVPERVKQCKDCWNQEYKGEEIKEISYDL